jgi:hypothetical protein
VPNDSESSSGGIARQPGRVIDLHGHQAAEQLLRQLERTYPDSRRFHSLARSAVALGRPFIAAIIRHLDSAEPERLAIFRHILHRYGLEVQWVPALMRVAHDGRVSDSRRLGAMIVLWNSYLHDIVPDDLLLALRNPVGSTATALARTIQACHRDWKLVEDCRGFLDALSVQPVDILHGVVNALAGMPGEGAEGALRFLALHPHPAVAEAALYALAERPLPGSLRALATLELNLPPIVAHTVARLLQKHRLTGYREDPLFQPNTGCRALVSAVDPAGTRLIWLQVPSELKDDHIALLCVVLSDMAGLMSAMAVSDLHPAGFAPSVPVGTLHEKPGSKLRLPRAGRQVANISCLEVPFDYGLRLLAEAVVRNWQTGNRLPVPYRVLFHHVWQFGATVRAGAYGGPTGSAPPYLARLDLPDKPDPALADAETELWSHPLFEGWYFDSEAVRMVAYDVAALGAGTSATGGLSEENWRVLLPSLIRLAHDEFGEEVRALYARRLRRMAEWLGLAGRLHEAAVAASAACTMEQSPPEANLSVIRLVQRGVLKALREIRAGRTPPHDPSL